MLTPRILIAMAMLWLFIPYHLFSQCAPPSTTLNGPSQVTAGSVSVYSLGTDTDNSMSLWYPVNGGSIIPSNGYATVLWNTPGTYTITVRPVSKCNVAGAELSKTVTVISQAVIAPPAITGPSSLCMGTTGNYSVPDIGKPVIWMFAIKGMIPDPFTPPIITTSSNTASLTWNNNTSPGSGTRVLVAAAYLEGTITGSVGMLEVTPKTAPFPTSIDGAETVCLDATSTYTISNYQPGDVMSWTLQGGGTLTTPSGWAQVKWTQSGGPYTLSVTLSNACASSTTSASKQVNVGPKAPATPGPITPQNTTLCLNRLESFSVPAVPGATSYIWSIGGPEGFSGSTINPTFDVTFTKTGNYYVSVIASNGICSSASPTISVPVGLPPNYITPFTDGNVRSVCVNGIITIKTTDLPGHTYNWVVEGGEIVGNATGSSINVKWATEGSKAISVTATSPCGLTSPLFPPFPTYPFRIYVQGPAMLPGNITGELQACKGKYIYTTPTDESVSTLTWSVEPSDAGTIQAMSGPPFPQTYPIPSTYIVWTSEGNHTVKAVLTNTCGTSVTRILSVAVSNAVKPESVSITGPGNNAVCMSTTPSTTFTVPAQSGVTYEWGFLPGYEKGTLLTGDNAATVTWTGTGMNYVTATPVTSSCRGDRATLYTSIDKTPVPATLSTTVTTICDYGSVPLTVTGGSNHAQNFQVRRQLDGGAWSAWSDVYPPVSVNSIGANTVARYEFRAEAMSYTCGNTYSNVVAVDVYPYTLSGTITALPTTSCSNAPITLTLTGNRGTAKQWYVRAAGGNDVLFSNSSENSVTYTPVNNGTANISYAFYAIVQYQNCDLAATREVSTSVRPSVPLTVNPQTICSGQSTNIPITSTASGATFAWTVQSATNVTGASAGSGSTISQILTNATTVARTVVYRVTATANGCASAYKDVTVTVNPLPAVTASNKVICSGNSPGVALSSGVSGATFAWKVQSATNVTGSSNGTGTPISQVLTNTATINGTVVYRVNATANGCMGPHKDVTVTVRPVTTITTTDKSICTGQSTNLTLTSPVSVTTFTWTVASATNATGAISGSGSLINQTLTNSTNAIGTVVYRVTPKVSTCTGTIKDITVTVNPTATGSASGATICSGQSTNIPLSSPVSGATFSWAVQSETGVTGAYSGNGSIISQVLSATTSSTGSVVYRVTPSINNCVGTPFDVTAMVNPKPDASASDQTICSGAATNIPITSALNGTTFSWAVQSATDVTGASSGSGNSISQVLTNTSIGTRTVVYAITPMLQGCVGSPINATVTVNPVPYVSAENQYITSGSTTSIALTGVEGSVFTWVVHSATNVSGATGGTGNSINQTLTSASSGEVIYRVTPSLSGCTGNYKDVTVYVTYNPTITNGSTVVCSGSFVKLQVNQLLGATYQWRKDGLIISGATSPVYNAYTAGSYSVTVSKSSWSGTSAPTAVSFTGAYYLSILSGQYICTGESMELTASAPGHTCTYQWNTGATSQAITVTSGGRYTVTTVDLAGCGDSETVRVTETTACARIKSETSADQEQTRVGVSYYPNPVNHELVIQLEKPASLPFAFQLTSTTGIDVLQGTIEKGEQKRSVAVSHLCSGIYFLRLQNDGGTISKKVIIVHD